MTTKNFVNYHVLISHSPSCLNRDDMNMQKDVIFGGVRRVRYSSQSLKRAIRKSAYYKNTLGEPSVRTRDLDELKGRYTAQLEDRYSAELVGKALEWICGNEIGSDAKATAVAPWAVDEVARFCEEIQKGGEDLDEKKLHKKIKKDARLFTEALRKTVDIALSGRMATSGLMTKIDGAMAVAHVITTHEVESDIDWFTAMDDLADDSGETGAGHLNTQEFSAGVFYRYASLDLGQLQTNLGDVPRERALEIAGHLAHMMATVVPAAKQQSFAAHNPADLVMVSLSDMPISLANAFEAPVPTKNKSGFLAPSVSELLKYWQNFRPRYEIDETTALFETRPPNEKDKDGQALRQGLIVKETLPDLRAWLQNDGA